MRDTTWTMTFTPPGEPARRVSGIPHDDFVEALKTLMFSGELDLSAVDSRRDSRIAAIRDPRSDVTARAA